MRYIDLLEMKSIFDLVKLKKQAHILKMKKKNEDWIKAFNDLKPGSVIKLTKHPKFDLAISEIYLLKTYLPSKWNQANKSFVAVNIKSGALWEKDHIDGIEFEVIKEV